MTFHPTRERLLPDLSPAEELVLLARTLWREGYDDHLAGHITIRQPDGTLLCNPWLLLWNEFRADDVIRIDLDGNVVEGDWPVPPGIPLHLELHRRRHVPVALHHHPRFGTIWADLLRVPGCYDQSSALGGGAVALVDEYGGTADNVGAARAAVEAAGDADIALLANHGVFVLGDSVRTVFQRAVAFEQRCRHAWLVEAAGGGRELPAKIQAWFRRLPGDGFAGFWEAMARQELRLDPALLESRGRIPASRLPV